MFLGSSVHQISETTFIAPPLHILPPVKLLLWAWGMIYTRGRRLLERTGHIKLQKTGAGSLRCHSPLKRADEVY